MSRCDEFRKLQALEIADELTARQFARLDRHRAACPGCAAEARRDEPLELFQALAGETRDESFWSGFQQSLHAGMQEEGRLGPSESLLLLRPAYRVALAAVLVLGLGLMAGLLAPDLEPQAPADGLPGDALAARMFPMDSAGDEIMLPTVESIESDEAMVYEMKVFGENDEVTQLVMIFDEEIDL
jgi:hypothetical protein